MKHEEGLVLKGEMVVLVPYKPLHVPKYHNWMGDEEVLRLTGSERLSLQQEYEMQQSWERDHDKCTFIILDKDKYEGSNGDEVLSMVGDTNLFLNVEEEEGTAEIEIMIAEKDARRKGFATEALKMMMNYGNEQLGRKKYIAKIKDDNESSIRLFERLGFQFQSKSEVFKEVTLTYHVV